jgi:hypothetical protein
LGKIVWLASYPKSGNTWVRAFLHNYIAQPEAPRSINALTDFSVAECVARFFHKPGETLSNEEVQRRRPSVHEGLTKLHDDLVFVKTHNANLAVHNVPLCTPEHTAGAVYIIRDPRDVVLSYSAFTGRSFDEIIDFMGNDGAANRATEAQVFELLASWSAHVSSWGTTRNKLLVRYEDLLAAPEKHFGRIINFLGGAPEQNRLRRAVAFSDFKILSAQESEHGYNARGPDALAPFFRAGISGQWNARLTPGQIARIENNHGAVMRKFGYL